MPTVYEIITDRMIERIRSEKRLPWRKPWKNYLSASGAPQNFASKKPYRGMNVFLLGGLGYDSPFFLSYKQSQELGGQVRKGEKGHIVTFWCPTERKNSDTGKKDRGLILRYHTVFNVTQCDGLNIPAPIQVPEDPRKIENADAIVSSMQKAPKITHNEARAYYSTGDDRVNMPRKDSFANVEEYYSTLFHQLGHATGHESRLNRPTLTAHVSFGSQTYSQEELVAEMTATFLCAESCIDNPAQQDNSVAYLQSWLEKLKENPTWLVKAAGQAQKASDFILNRTQQEIE